MRSSLSPLILVTRPRQDALRSAVELQRAGYRTFVEPMITLAAAPWDTARLKEAEHVIVSAPEGARQILSAGLDPDATVWAVGPGSARPLAGHARLKVASGSGASLLHAISEFELPPGRRFLHVSGREIVVDFAPALRAMGHSVERVVAYESRATPRLTPACEMSIRTGRIDVAAFFSAKAAFAFRAAICTSGLRRHISTMSAVALSGRIAHATADLGWRELKVANEPNTKALLAALE